MQFRDRALLRLLDAGERAALLTNAVGDRLSAAAFACRRSEAAGGATAWTTSRRLSVR
ncbi:hypothetical protein ACFYWX_31720 [Streptomyces sp. NPDC002888]|uniref:hypothetical protein n=1 Tax=Streptomyces sp. NPDC002888 TaxID=3364668 RepID=UPI00367770C2